MNAIERDLPRPNQQRPVLRENVPVVQSVNAENREFLDDQIDLSFEQASKQFAQMEQRLFDAIEDLQDMPLQSDIESLVVPPDATMGERYDSATMQALKEAIFSLDILRSANNQNRSIAELLQKAVDNGRLDRMLQAKRAVGEYLKLDPKIARAINAMADAAEAYATTVKQLG